METFCKQLDMSNLRTILENDSDYGDEDATSRGGAAANMSLSVSSV